AARPRAIEAPRLPPPERASEVAKPSAAGSPRDKGSAPTVRTESPTGTGLTAPRAPISVTPQPKPRPPERTRPPSAAPRSSTQAAARPRADAFVRADGALAAA